MSHFTSRILAVSLVVSMLLVAVYACRSAQHAALLSGVTSISSIPPDWNAGPLWEPPYKKIEMLVLPANQRWSIVHRVHGDSHIRPAWGIFAALVATFFYYWMYATYGANSTGLDLVLPLR